MEHWFGKSVSPPPTTYAAADYWRTTRVSLQFDSQKKKRVIQEKNNFILFKENGITYKLATRFEVLKANS